MGCCYSKRPDPTSEQGKSNASAESLKLEMAKKVIAQELSRTKHKKRRISKLRTKRLSFSSSSPNTLSLISSSNSSSTKTSIPNPPSSQINKNFSEQILNISVGENFTTIRKLHSGNYGDTLIVTDRRTGLKKVIKEVIKSIIQEKEKDKLILEIQKFLCLDHPNIVKLHEVYESKKKWSFVYEHLIGNSLLHKFNNEIIGSALAQTIMRDILSGLNYCHRNRVAHLGLNLEKVILDSNDGMHNCILILMESLIAK